MEDTFEQWFSKGYVNQPLDGPFAVHMRAAYEAGKSVRNQTSTKDQQTKE